MAEELFHLFPFFIISSDIFATGANGNNIFGASLFLFEKLLVFLSQFNELGDVSGQCNGAAVLV